MLQVPQTTLLPGPYPQESGWYWFYGDPFYPESHPERKVDNLHMVRVRKIANGFAYIADGNLFANKAPGLWCSAFVPTVSGDIRSTNVDGHDI